MSLSVARNNNTYVLDTDTYWWITQEYWFNIIDIWEHGALSWTWCSALFTSALLFVSLVSVKGARRNLASTPWSLISLESVSRVSSQPCHWGLHCTAHTEVSQCGETLPLGKNHSSVQRFSFLQGAIHRTSAGWSSLPNRGSAEQQQL